MTEPLLSEISRPGRTGHSLPAPDVPPSDTDDLPSALLRAQLDLPEIPENEVVRHFVRLSRLNYGVDSGFYPLGSCTMKYNSKAAEKVAAWPEFTDIHPLQPEETVQGSLQLMYELQQMLGEITGLRAASLQPAAGAHGELAGMMMVRAYHESRGDRQRTKVLIPDSAHGTNPATAAMCGYSVVPVRSDERGNVDLDALESLADDHTAALMLTMPNTLGLFDENMLAVSETVHRCGALLYGDGANLNALLGIALPADLGFDVMHVNLHKTFGTPHGGGGPGSGPVLAREFLAGFLPVPIARRKDDGTYTLDHDLPASIGRVRSFHGSFGVLVKAYVYLRALGSEGVRRVGESAVLNANYLRARLEKAYELAYPRTCMHEFVLSGRRQKARGVHTLDIAKRLIDFGYHPPTIYFPLVVDEAMMIEPTETETKETLDAFADALLAIAREVEEHPELVTRAPTSTPVCRLDAVAAARRPRLHW